MYVCVVCVLYWYSIFCLIFQEHGSTDLDDSKTFCSYMIIFGKDVAAVSKIEGEESVFEKTYKPIHLIQATFYLSWQINYNLPKTDPAVSKLQGQM